MKIRILREPYWTTEFTRPDIIGPGCGAHEVLRYKDTLQFSEDGVEWEDIPIVELPISESPRHKQEREKMEKCEAEIKLLWGQISSEDMEKLTTRIEKLSKKHTSGNTKP